MGLNENGYVFSRDGASMFLEVYGEQFPKEIIAGWSRNLDTWFE